MAGLVGGDRGIGYTAVLAGGLIDSHQMPLVVVVLALAVAWGVVCMEMDLKP